MNASVSDAAPAARAGAGVRRSPVGGTGDPLFIGLTCALALLVLAALGGLLIALAWGSWPAFRAFGLGFFVSESWNPVTERFGALAPIYGTLVTAAIAMAIAVPVSFGTAIFLVELSPDWARRPIGTAIELLAAIPSIIYGMWGLFVFAPFMATHVQPFLKATIGAVPGLDPLVAGPPLGIGVLTASIILGFMVVPFVCAIMRDVLISVPPQLRESAYAIGCTTWETVWRILVPQTRAALIGAMMLGLGRALGETMAVTFVIGNAHAIKASLLAPGNTIASTVANEFTEAIGDIYQASLIALGLTLFAISFGVLALARLMLRRLNARAAA